MEVGDLNSQLRDIDFYLRYGENMHKVEDYNECYIAYRECINITKHIFENENTHKMVVEALLPQARSWLEKTIALKNVLWTKNYQSRCQRQCDPPEPEPFDFRSKVEHFLESPEGCYIDDKIKDKMLNLVTVLNLEKPTIQFADLIGAKEEITTVKETIIYSLGDEDGIKQFRKGYPNGCLFYGKSNHL